MSAADEKVIASFKGDEQRRMDYATPLMLVAAVLTALSLLVNSLLLSVESNRMTLAQLRMAGLTRLGTVGFVTMESFFAAVIGWALGVGGAAAALFAYVAADAQAFPMGAAFAGKAAALTFVMLLAVAAVIATPRGRLPLALRGLYRLLRRDLASDSVDVGSDSVGNQPAWKRIVAFIIVLIAIGLCLI